MSTGAGGAKFIASQPRVHPRCRMSTATVFGAERFVDNGILEDQTMVHTEHFPMKQPKERVQRSTRRADVTLLLVARANSIGQRASCFFRQLHDMRHNLCRKGASFINQIV